jgi:hypothetical protein
MVVDTFDDMDCSNDGVESRSGTGLNRISRTAKLVRVATYLTKAGIDIDDLLLDDSVGVAPEPEPNTEPESEWRRNRCGIDAFEGRIFDSTIVLETLNPEYLQRFRSEHKTG